jgi:hypothetical protein
VQPEDQLALVLEKMRALGAQIDLQDVPKVAKNTFCFAGAEAATV